MTDVLVIAGLSGAGRSQAADDIEDLGWFVIDNLPTSLVEKVVELASSPLDPHSQLALVVGNVSQQSDMLEAPITHLLLQYRGSCVCDCANSPRLLR